MDLIGLHVKAEEALATAVVGEEVEGLTLSVVLDLLYGGVEVSGQRCDLARGHIHPEELVLVAIARAPVGQDVPDTLEAIGRTRHEDILCAGDEVSLSDLDLTREDRVYPPRGGRVAKDSRLVEGRVLPVLGIEPEEELLPVGRDV